MSDELDEILYSELDCLPDAVQVEEFEPNAIEGVSPEDATSDNIKVWLTLVCNILILGVYTPILC